MPFDASFPDVVVRWSGAANAPFTQAEQDTLADLLTQISMAVLPHIVDDAVLTADQRNRFTVGRTVGYVEDWLAQIAAPMRRSFDIDGAAFEAESTRPALGMRSATETELEALPVLGAALAKRVSQYLGKTPGAGFDDLTKVDGIGAAGLETLRGVSYVDRARAGLVSPSSWNFAQAPGVDTLIVLLENSDLSLVFGDAHTVDRRVGAVGSVPERLAQLLGEILIRAEAASFPAGGMLANEALAWLTRAQRLEDALNAAQPATGQLLINGSYVDAAKKAIDDAQTSVSVMVFLGTTAEAPDGAPAPDTLIDALEAAHARGVAVRVILDRDDIGDPYKSWLINKALFDRLTAAGIAVKYDEKDVLLHSKIAIIDQDVTVVGSHNWTRSGFNNTHELSVLVESANLGQDYQSRFDALWGQLP